MFGEAYTVRFRLMPILIDLAQVGFRVEMDARFVRVADDAATKVHLFIAALSAFVADRFPFHRAHDPCSISISGLI